MSQNVDHTSAIPPESPEGQSQPADAVGLDPTSQVVSPPPATARHGLSLVGTPTGLLLALGAATIVLYGMHYASGVLNSIFLALFITMGATPALHWMQRKGLKPWLAVTIVLIVFVILGVLFVTIMAGSISQLDDKLPVYKENLSHITESVNTWLSNRGVNANGLLSGAISPAKIIDFASGLLGSVIGAMSSIVLMILIVLFMISAAYSFPRAMNQKLNLNSAFTKALANFGETTRSFLWTKAWLSFIVAVAVTLVFYAFGVDFALLWGLLFFILSFIPNIGFVLSVIPPFFITLLEFGFARAAIVVVIVIVMNSIVDNVLSPKIVGRSVGLSSLVVFLSVIVWGWVFGGIGALISVPLTLMVKLLFFDLYESTRPISELMAAGITQVSKQKKKVAGAAGKSET